MFGRKSEKRADPQRINELERELGIGPGAAPKPPRRTKGQQAIHTPYGMVNIHPTRTKGVYKTDDGRTIRVNES